MSFSGSGTIEGAYVLAVQPLTLVSGAALTPHTYRLTDLGTLGGAGSFGFALSATGRVTGDAYTVGNASQHAFLWNGTTTEDLGTLGGTSSYGRAINDAGQVTGYAKTTADEAFHAFRWNGSTMQDLGTLGGDTSSGNAINASGQVTGSAFVVGGAALHAIQSKGDAAHLGIIIPPDPFQHAFLWNGTAMQDLGTLGGSDSIGKAINDAGQVTGWAAVNFFASHAFRSNGAYMQDLGTLGGSNSEGIAINASGQVTGNAWTTGDVAVHAFLWKGTTMQNLGSLGGNSFGSAINASGQVTGYAYMDPGNVVDHAFLWNGSTMQDLGTLGGTRSVGRAINDLGQVTGFAWTAGSAADHAFLWDGAVMQKLDSLVDPNDLLKPYVSLSQGWKINSRGQILASGCDSRTSECHAYIVSPIPIIGPKVVPDTNSDGVQDVAVIRDEPIRAEIRSGKDGALIKTLVFLDGTMIPLDAQTLPDSDGNGIPELAMLAIRKSDNRCVVQVRNIAGTPAARSIWFAAGQMPVSMAVIKSDTDNNGVPELAVLSRRNSDGRGLVEVKNASGVANAKSIWMGVGLTPLDLEIVDDADKNGVAEVAVLSRRNSDARNVVEVKNAAGATNPATLYFMAGDTAIDLAIVSDADGNTVPEAAVLSSRNSDGRNSVEIRNAAGAANPSKVWFAAGYRALAVKQIADADGNSVPEIAVLSTRKSDGRSMVEVKNAAGAPNPNALWYPAGFTARDLTIFEDVDGKGIEDADVLLTRASDGRILVQSHNAAGALETRNYWFSP